MYKLPMMKASEVSRWCKTLKGKPVLLLDIERRIRQNVWQIKRQSAKWVSQLPYSKNITKSISKLYHIT